MNWKHFDNNETKYQLLFWLLIAVIQASIGAATVIADYQRLEITTLSWQPIVWESSSQIAGGLLIYMIVWFDHKLATLTSKPLIRVLAHASFSIVYSVSHVMGMVLLRKTAYMFVGENYNFGDWPSELIYEYTKDGYSYIWIVGIIYAYRFIIVRLRGEAKAIAFGEDEKIPDRPERLLVKKIGKEFIIKIEDIEWIEASGNYMNLHIANHVYPLRETMSNLENKLNPKHFARIHRSTIVNLDFVKEIQASDSGDHNLMLSSGKSLKLSRRYREHVKSNLL